MGHTFVANRIHLVFSTKERRGQIRPELQKNLWAYLGGIARNCGIVPIIIGGTDDHAHLLLSIPPTLALASAAQKLKANSSRWMVENGVSGFGWQEGYSAFSVSISHEQATVRYIANQLVHHRKQDFNEEIREFLRRHQSSAD